MDLNASRDLPKVSSGAQDGLSHLASAGRAFALPVSRTFQLPPFLHRFGMVSGVVLWCFKEKAKDVEYKIAVNLPLVAINLFPR